MLHCIIVRNTTINASLWNLGEGWIELLGEFWFLPFYMNFTSLVHRYHRCKLCWRTYLNTHTINNLVWSVQKTSPDYSNPLPHPADTGHTFLWHRSFFPRRHYTSGGVQVGAGMSNCRSRDVRRSTVPGYISASTVILSHSVTSMGETGVNEISQ